MTNVRPAKLTDRPHFMRLWDAHLREQHALGSHLLPTKRNLLYYQRLCEAYINGYLFGTVLLWEDDIPQGITMSGQDWGEPGLDYDIGTQAYGWGIYVSPDYRRKKVSHELMYEHWKAVKAQGYFDVLVTHVAYTNAPSQASLNSYGWEKIELSYLYDVHKFGKVEKE